MYPFVESIKFLNNQYYHLEYHQARMDTTRFKHYPGNSDIILKNTLVPAGDLVSDQIYKCRVIYGEEISEVIYEPYIPRFIKQYYLVVCPDNFDYSYKLTNRIFFDTARQKLKSDEDYIYVRKGLITDTSYANIVFSDGAKLYTPSHPLLKGTKRAFYLDSGIIIEEEIKVKDLRKFKSFYVINAMLDLESAPAFSCDKLLLSHNHLKL